MLAMFHNVPCDDYDVYIVLHSARRFLMRRVVCSGRWRVQLRRGENGTLADAVSTWSTQKWGSDWSTQLGDPESTPRGGVPQMGEGTRGAHSLTRHSRKGYSRGAAAGYSGYSRKGNSGYSRGVLAPVLQGYSGYSRKGNSGYSRGYSPVHSRPSVRRPRSAALPRIIMLRY